MTSDADSIDAYIAGFPCEVQLILEEIRAVICLAAPDATETISYRIPSFELNGTYLIYFAGFKNHVSVYPILSECPEFEDELAPYRSGKATAKFPLDKPIPFPLITKIVQFMTLENERRTEQKPKRMERKS
jgi:uncharacterized protein YdhG (YjbR/CyaY superfamily)